MRRFLLEASLVPNLPSIAIGLVVAILMAIGLYMFAGHNMAFALIVGPLVGVVCALASIAVTRASPPDVVNAQNAQVRRRVDSISERIAGGPVELAKHESQVRFGSRPSLTIIVVVLMLAAASLYFIRFGLVGTVGSTAGFLIAVTLLLRRGRNG
jgi:Na+/melibiose symporter-like transporter